MLLVAAPPCRSSDMTNRRELQSDAAKSCLQKASVSYLTAGVINQDATSSVTLSDECTAALAAPEGGATSQTRGPEVWQIQ